MFSSARWGSRSWDSVISIMRWCRRTGARLPRLLPWRAGMELVGVALHPLRRADEPVSGAGRTGPRPARPLPRRPARSAPAGRRCWLRRVGSTRRRGRPSSDHGRCISCTASRRRANRSVELRPFVAADRRLVEGLAGADVEVDPVGVEHLQGCEGLGDDGWGVPGGRGEHPGPEPLLGPAAGAMAPASRARVHILACPTPGAPRVPNLAAMSSALRTAAEAIFWR